MHLPLDPFRLLLILLASGLNQHQRDVIDYLQEENRLLREQLGSKRLRLNDDQRRPLARAVGQWTGRRLFRRNPLDHLKITGGMGIYQQEWVILNAAALVRL